jgi:hypothetical protein
MGNKQTVHAGVPSKINISPFKPWSSHDEQLPPPYNPDAIPIAEIEESIKCQSTC